VGCVHSEAVDPDGEIYCLTCGQVMGYVVKEEVKISDDGSSNFGPATNRHSLPDSVRLGSAPPPITKKKPWLKSR